MNYAQAHSPPCKGGVAAALIKSREATLAPQTGWSLTECVSECILRRVCERPPRPRLFGTGPFFDGAATPPLQGGEYARLNSFTASIPHWERRDCMRIATWLWMVLTLGVAFAFGVAPAGAQSNPIFVSLQGGAKPCFIGQTTTS